VSGIITSERYAASKADLCDRHPRIGELIEAIEWELLLATDFTRYPTISFTSTGQIRAYRVTSIAPGVLVIFSFEDHQGTRKVLLLDCAIPAADDP
jgi:hypothetical protein